LDGFGSIQEKNMAIQGKRGFDVEKDAKWRRVMSEFSKSGLTAREFCHRNSISEPSFYSWKRTLKQRDQGDTTGDGNEANMVVNGAAPTPALPRHIAPGFASVEVVGQHEFQRATCEKVAIGIDLGDIQLRVSPDCPPELVESVLGKLLRSVEPGGDRGPC
jgi:hypothetical protein